MHYKTDLLNDEQLAAFRAKIGDTIALEVPKGDGKFEHQECQIANIDIIPIGTHPETGERLTQVTLALQ
jgi:hypothetical protein